MKKDWLCAIIGILGVCTFGVGVMSTVGYVAEVSNFYHWTGDTPMALNTAICFAVNGLALYLISIDCERRAHEAGSREESTASEVRRRREARQRTLKPKDAIAALVIIACSVLLIVGVSATIAGPGLIAVVVHYFSDPRLKAQ